LQFQEGRGRVYLNRNGINASVCVPHKHEPDVREFFNCILEAVPGSIRVTKHCTDFNVFPSLRVKHGKLPEGFGEDFDINLSAGVQGNTWMERNGTGSLGTNLTLFC